MDDGSKNIPYCISLGSKHMITVMAREDFDLDISNNTRVIRVNTVAGGIFRQDDHSLRNKLAVLKTMLLNIRRHGLIHAFFALSPETSGILLLAKFLFGKTIIINVTYWDEKAARSRLVKLFLKKADSIIAMSEYSAGRIRKHSDNTRVIRPVVNPEKYKPGTREAVKRLRKKLGLQAGHIVIYPGEYGVLGANKNIINIVRLVNKELDDALFIFSCRLRDRGDIEKEKYVKSELAGYSVLFLNTVDNYHEYAAVSDTAVFPAGSMEEKVDLPLALVELMAMGKPVIHTDIPPLNELYSKKDGFCLPEAPDAIAKRIISLASDSALYEEACRRTLEEAGRFLPENVIPEYDEIYDRLIQA